MAAPTKSRTSLFSGTSLGHAGATTNSSWIDLSTVFESQIDIKLSVGSAGATTGASIQIQVAANYNAGSPTLVTNYGGALLSGVGASEVDYFSVPIPIGVAAVRIAATGGTGTGSTNDVTIDADISTVTAIS